MLASTFASLLAVAAIGARAVHVDSPDMNTVWSSGDSSDTVKWSTVSTDPTSFDILLVNMASFPTSSTTLLKGVSASAGSASVSAPSGGFPVGNAFQINFVNSQTSSILAQSVQFNITQSSSAASASSSSAASSSASSSSAVTASMASSSRSASASSTSATGSAASASTSGSSTNSVEIPGASAVSTKSGAFSVVSLPSALLVAAVGLATVTLA